MSFNNSRWKTSDTPNPVSDTNLLPTTRKAQSASTSNYSSASAAPPKPKVAQMKYVEYAGFWLRFWAHIIDTILIVAVIDGPIFLIESFETWLRADIVNALLYLGWSIILPWLYYAVMESGAGATIGKQAFGLKVTDMDGNRLSFWRATGRYFAQTASRLTLGFGYIMIGFTEKRQAMHDMMAGCLVVKDIR